MDHKSPPTDNFFDWHLMSIVAHKKLIPMTDALFGTGRVTRSILYSLGMVAKVMQHTIRAFRHMQNKNLLETRENFYKHFCKTLLLQNDSNI